MERKYEVVSTSSGKLRGTFQLSCLGDEYYAFKGIPYAKPPIGPLRFRDPQPVEPWSDILDATEHGSIAAQWDATLKRYIGSEICLYLNVYTRNLEPSVNAPVMFWIHGGAFQFGSGNEDQFGPDFLLSRDVVLVTINYRLGIFGFLDLEDKAAPGNQGLKDQVMALKWVRDNIANFGGDPDNVTIFGGSAGAASVHYLAMSPLARDLFHKAICQSGTAISPWASKREPKKTVYELLKYFNFVYDRNPRRIVDFLQQINFTKLVEAQQQLLTPLDWMRGTFPFVPGVDDKADEPFLDVPPSIAALEGVQKPFILGWNSLEGLMMLNFIRELDLEDINENFENYMVPSIREILQPYQITFEDFKRLYFNGEAISEHNLPRLLELLGDIFFKENIHRIIKLQFHKSPLPTFIYKLSYNKNLTLANQKLNTPIKGVNHGDELTYLFRAKICDKLSFVQLQEGTGADKVMKEMVEFWTSFAKTGRPYVETSGSFPFYWQQLASDIVLRYLNIDEKLSMEKELSLEMRYCNKKLLSQLR